jgi:hypothetical protein
VSGVTNPKFERRGLLTPPTGEPYGQRPTELISSILWRVTSPLTHGTLRHSIESLPRANPAQGHRLSPQAPRAAACGGGTRGVPRGLSMSRRQTVTLPYRYRRKPSLAASFCIKPLT